MDEMTMEKTPEQVAAIEAAMTAEGVSLYQSGQQDYFGFESVDRIKLPDGTSYIEHRILNEGQRRKYLNKVNREVKVQRATGDAVMKMAPGEEKKALLEAAICGWNLMRNGQPVPFNTKNLDEFLDKANPKVIDLIEKEIRKGNSWLQADMSVEDIDREITQLQELRQQKLEEEEGKDS
jgi:hypothetical protein